MPKFEIVIDINNNPEILDVIIKSLPFLPNKWTVDANVNRSNNYWQSVPNKIPRFFYFNFDNHNFEWMCYDHDNPQASELHKLTSISAASKFMDYIYENDLRRIPST